MDTPGEQKPNTVGVFIPEGVETPKYANMVQVSCTDVEFLIDFIMMSPPKPAMQARIIVTPEHMERIIKAFQENLATFNGRKIEKLKQGKGI